ncbi:MAG: ATP synthase subunit I [Acidobacteria bacterium]|nr:ATP synthase subunit I [Acidobacteriota bacterium]
MTEEKGNEIERRFRRNMLLVIVVALVTGFYWSGWRMALGILLGGSLCIFNLRWLGGSVRAILSHAAELQNKRVPPFTASKFILRYLIIALAIGAAVWTGDFHPLGIGIGFGAFAGGVMIEAGYQIYLFIRSTNQ